MSDTISVTIKSSGDTKYEIEVSPSITILELKNEIASKSSITADRQRLIYSGKVLKDSETVASYKIQNGHTIHMVKSAASSQSTAGTATPSGNANPSSTTSTGAPSNIAAGSGSFNPLADLTGARYAGYTQLPSASMFGPDGGMNSNMPDPEEMSQMMSNPMFQESMNAVMSNPQMLEFMINQNPQFRGMGPQIRQMMQSPLFRQMISNPETMRSMMEMNRNMRGSFGQQNTNAFPAPGENPTANVTNSGDATPTDQSHQNAAGAAGAAGANNSNPFASLFAGGAPPIDPFALFGGGANAAPADTRPPEERYETELRQLNDMGFFDFDRNIEALRRTGGSVQGAVEYLLNSS